MSILHGYAATDDYIAPLSRGINNHLFQACVIMINALHNTDVEYFFNISMPVSCFRNVVMNIRLPNITARFMLMNVRDWP